MADDANNAAHAPGMSEKVEATNGLAHGLPSDAEKQQPQAAQDGQQEQQGDKPDGVQEKKSEQPAGGYDGIPVPKRPSGYTIKVTIHKATNLPMADMNTLSSDPYVLAEFACDTPTRHKEDPPIRFRTPTIRQNTDPEWNEEWIIANAPTSGFKLKFRVYDEDPNDKDDRLGNVHVTVDSLNENWQGISKKPYEIKVKSGSKRAYGIRALAVCFRSTKHMRGDLVISVELLGRTKEDGQSGRVYTVGPCRWVRHYDPMLGRIAHTKDDDSDEESADRHQSRQNAPQQASAGGENPTNSNQPKKDQKVQRYNFQANQIQLEGPVPWELYHRYVEFKPWVKRMFTSSGLQGMILGKALHHQHSRVYNFDKQTVWGHFPEGPSEALTKQFLDLVHWDKAGRIFTYVLTLDALWRFTETGKEFGIDMLSKHSMHSDVSIYIAFSGEFFIRRLKHGHRPPPPDPIEDASQSHPPAHQENEEHPPKAVEGGPPDAEPPRDPARYELVIDNDSGTYRPNAKMLPLLKKFLARSLPGLHILTLDCQADEEKMSRMKEEQRERKKAEGDHIIYRQGSRSSSISSSDEEEFERMEANMGAGGGMENEPVSKQRAREVLQAGAKDQTQKGKARVQKLKADYGGFVGGSGHRDAEGGGGVGSEEALREGGANAGHVDS
ncbi:hypothetical protein EJ03DRAFT_147889 [Teratosphaeria nubilosa]|uniref:C2 domain-containing protein n=1 Tax=Teratosphaeria nubilosa TaxID=161662 RepID=A0A6G1L3C9_9PEZI|nr:hypothetical protein EJ03DRAFT_147889 [Teratosphaeria nubilosa]